MLPDPSGRRSLQRCRALPFIMVEPGDSEPTGLRVKESAGAGRLGYPDTLGQRRFDHLALLFRQIELPQIPALRMDQRRSSEGRIPGCRIAADDPLICRTSPPQIVPSSP